MQVQDVDVDGSKAGERDCGQQEALAKGEPRVNTDDKSVTERVVFWKPVSLNKTAITVPILLFVTRRLPVQNALVVLVVLVGMEAWLAPPQITDSRPY